MALVTAGVSSARALIAEGAAPDMVCGHSVGAIAALVIAGVLEFSDALRLAKLRGALMEKAYPSGYGMGVIIGLREVRVKRILEGVYSKKVPVFIGNLNSPDQIVITGAIEAISKVMKLASGEGAERTQTLNVSVPSHCALMDPVAGELYRRTQDIVFHYPTLKYISSCKARCIADPDKIREDLIQSVTLPVRWNETTSLLSELGTSLFIEACPGNVLTTMSKKAFPQTRSISLGDGGLESAIYLAHQAHL